MFRIITEQLRLEGTPWYHIIKTLFRQDQLEQFDHDYVQSGLEHHQRWRLRSLSGWTISMFDHYHSKKVFFCVQMEFHVFWFVPVASCPVTRHYQAKSGSIFTLFHQVLIRSPLKLTLPRLTSPRFLSLSSSEKCSWPIITFVTLCWTCFSMSVSFSHWGGENWTQQSSCALTSAEQRGRITSFGLLSTLFLMQPRLVWAPFTVRVHCWLMITQNHKGLLCWAAFQPVSLQLSSISRSLWMAAQPSGLSPTPSSFVSVGGVTLALSSLIRLTKTISSYGPPVLGLCYLGSSALSSFLVLWISSLLAHSL